MNDNNLQNPIPGTPETPVTPVTPVDPFAAQQPAPVAPVAPAAPVAPVEPAPVAPVAPVAPAPVDPMAAPAPAPVQPVAPAPAPVDPMAPVAPAPQPVGTAPVAPVPAYAPAQEPVAAPAEKKDNKKLFIIIGVVAVLVVVGIVCAIVFLGKGNGSGNSAKGNGGSGTVSDKDKEVMDKYAKEKQINAEIKDKYETKVYLVGEDLVVEYKNLSDHVVDNDLKIEFYDANNNPVGVETTYVLDVAPKATAYLPVYYDVEEKPFANYKVTGVQRLGLDDTNYLPKIEIVSQSESGDEYLVQVKNNSDKDFETVYAVVFFLDANGEKLAIERLRLENIKAGETGLGKCYLPSGKSYREKFEYAKAEVVIYGASTPLEQN